MNISQKRVALATSSLITIILLIFAFRAVYRICNPIQKPGNNNQHIIYQIEGSTERSYYIYENNLLVVDNKGICAVNKSGAETWRVEFISKSPQVKISGKYILIYDYPGTSFAVISRGQVVYKNEKTESEIILGSINSAGFASIVTESMGYKNKLTVYDPLGAEYYYWNTSSGYIVAARTTTNGKKIAIASIFYENTKQMSGITIINASDESIEQEATYENTVFADIAYLNDKSLLVISDVGTYRLDENLSEIYKIDYNGKILQHYDYNKNGKLALAFSNSKNTSTVEIYNKRGVLSGALQSSFEARGVVLSQGLVAVCGARDIAIYNEKGLFRTHTAYDRSFRFLNTSRIKSGFFSVAANNVEFLTVDY